MSLSDRISALAVAMREKVNVMVPRLLPPGGAAGQVLAKSAAGDYAAEWQTSPSSEAPSRMLATMASNRDVTFLASTGGKGVLPFIASDTQITGPDYTINDNGLFTINKAGKYKLDCTAVFKGVPAGSGSVILAADTADLVARHGTLARGYASLPEPLWYGTSGAWVIDAPAGRQFVMVLQLDWGFDFTASGRYIQLYISKVG